MKKINIIITFIGVSFLFGCATHQPQYRTKDTNQELPPSGKEVDHTFFLLGDAGYVEEAESSVALRSFQEYIKENTSKNSHVIFLGNSFYPSGMSSETPSKASNIKDQLKAIEAHKGKVMILPGELDWRSSVDGLEYEEDFLKARYDGKDILQPNNGCPLESIEIGDDIQLIVIDSQWYIESWDDHPKMNDKCEIKTRRKFFIEIEGELKKNKGKTILFATHHPLITNGKHGGRYTALNQILPVPGLATVITQVRSQGAISKQDRYNERYNDLMSRLNVMAKDHDQLVFVSGHDRSLQYSEDRNTKQIVSGAAGDPTAAALGAHGLFSFGGPGFTVVTVYKDGSSQAAFYKAEEDSNATLLFQKDIITAPKKYDTSSLPDSFPATVKASVYDDDRVERTGFFKTVWGDHYRKVYGTEVTAKVVQLDTLYGGLKVIRAGGGHQTRSLRLQDKEGRDYNMRALKKSAVQFLQTVIVKDKEVEDDFKDTLPEDLILDFYTAAHPYGAFTIPKLAAAANVFHTNPKLYYVPKQKALGAYNDAYGDELYMIVERPDEPYDGAIFNYPDDIESTDDLLDKIRSDEENVVDEKTYIRARVFDMLIGDWDRHNDQWRWAEFKDQDGKDVFVPIPRDRDQVYANFDGGLLDVVRALFSTSRQFQVYDSELKHTKWFNAAGIKLDRALVENYGREEWLAQATYLQQNVTDAVIENAFNDLPKEAMDETAQDIKNKLKGRRDNIVRIAGEYYDYFSELQIVTGTDKDDHFEITRLPDGETNIKVFRIKDGNKGEKIVDRTYNAQDTKELWVYGLDDDDVFEVSGTGNNPIFIRIVGGQNNDTYKIANGRKIKVYDHKSQKNTIEEKGGAGFRLTDNYNFNTYDYTKQIQSTNLFLPSIGANPDDGFKVGISNVYTVNGFQQNPFAQQHRFSAGYYVATQSFDLRYEGEFANIFGSYNFLIGGHFRNPNYAVNFFGFGNETSNPEYEDEDNFDLDYNRVRLGGYGGHFGVQKDSPYGSLYRFTARLDGYEVEDTPGRFISMFPVTELDETKFFASLEATYGYESYDNKVNPSRGMKFDLTVGVTQDIEGSNDLFGYVNPYVAFYNAITQDRKLVLKTVAQGQVRLGDGFEFYQAAQLGSDTGLRGYRDERFTGKTAAAGSADLRYSFNRFKTGLTPVQIGIFGGADAGRVWIPNEDSDVWHTDFGGGFWVNAADILSGTLNVFAGDEGIRLTFGLAVSM
ncbi:BamA/TamA family outer membrane protein [Altibacter sp.]|uniref:BamA/TamA family outer membrane protein n=1 Tax=Altibacter sp. TaxID=2024823 RepID=UPI002583ACC7|nr:BamA/TamA family outer membrane protein [Altibacter sp.]MCW9036428.1 phosphoesterase [Altibacter sp.]